MVNHSRVERVRNSLVLVIITHITGPESSKTRVQLAVSEAYATAWDALTSLIALPPGWHVLWLTAEYAAYAGPNDNHCHFDAIVAEHSVDRIVFLA
jgi:hypothetical protein